MSVFQLGRVGTSQLKKASSNQTRKPGLCRVVYPQNYSRVIDITGQTTSFITEIMPFAGIHFCLLLLFNE